ncbi:MAG: penicillin-binding protein 2 [Candidatus Puniceispirillales bacterium WSBS_2018_MAG_OTU23]
MITRASKLYAQKLTRRSLILGGVQGAMVLGLTGRLYYLQVEEARKYGQLSDRNKYDFRILPPSRGRIYDAEGRLLAGNAEVYELSITPLYSKNLKATITRLATLVDLSEDEIEHFFAEAAEKPKFLPIPIRADLSGREVARVVVRSPELPGVNFQRVEKRIYPQGLLGGHLTGYVNRATADEVDRGVITPELASLSTGKSGIEKIYERNLRGYPGRERIVVNAFGRPISTAIDEQPSAGADLHLSINMDDQLGAIEALKRGNNKPLKLSSPRVQSALGRDEELANILSDGLNNAFEDSQGRVVPPETGSVVVIDIKTGAVKTLVSSPTFDPNIFSGRLSTVDWNNMINNPRTPLLDRSLSGQYSPGSTFKMVVGLAALEAGVINAESRFFCNGHKKVGNQDFHCWLKGGHGWVDIISAIGQSCDVFFYEIGLKTGISRIADMARRLGLGEKTGINMPGEKPGLIPTKQWKEDNIGKTWTLGETVNSAIGQGYVLTTPLQLAVMTARIADGNRAITPRLTTEEFEPQKGGGQGFDDLNISPAALNIVKKGMRRVMNGAKGTARNHDLTASGIPIAGKTGTVQVKAISAAERARGIVDNKDRPWKHRDHALFVGYAPYINPRYAVVVVVEHGGGGSSTAAPIAKKVIKNLFRNGV